MHKLLLAIGLWLLLASSHAVSGERVRVLAFDIPPVMTYDTRTNAAGGIFVNVVQDTASREGWDLEFVFAKPAQALELLERGDVDLLAGVPYSELHKGRLTFNREIVVAATGRIYARPPSGIDTIRHLDGRKVAVLGGTALHKQLLLSADNAGVTPLVLEYADFEQAFRAVADGRAEAVLSNRFTGDFYAAQTGLQPTSVALPPYEFRFATKPGSAAQKLLAPLDRNLHLLKTDLDSVYYRDLRTLEDREREFQVPAWVYWGAAAGLILVAIAFGWALTLRRAAARVARSEAQLRKVNEELSRIHANSLDCIGVFDADFIVRQMNPAAEKLFGGPAGAFVGKSAVDLVPPEHRVETKGVFEKVRAGARLQGYSFLALRADGSIVPILCSLAWSEESQEMYAIGHDDTERLALISRLEHRTEQLQAVNRDLQTFAQSVSHDLRGPIAAVVGFVAKVLHDDADVLQNRSRELLARAYAAGQRIDSIIVNLLRLARVTEGGVHPRECDVTAMCMDVAAVLRNQDPTRAVVIDIQPDMRAHADRELLRHVFDNLLSNAWKFTSRKPGAHIKVGCGDDDRARTFFVQDDGAGFEMGRAHSLFLPFGRLHSEKEFAGIGIGLCIAHRVIQAHGGHLWAQGAVGKGAIFSFTLGAASAYG